MQGQEMAKDRFLSQLNIKLDHSKRFAQSMQHQGDDACIHCACRQCQQAWWRVRQSFDLRQSISIECSVHYIGASAEVAIACFNMLSRSTGVQVH